MIENSRDTVKKEGNTHGDLGSPLELSQHRLENLKKVLSLDVLRNDTERVYISAWTVDSQPVRPKGEYLATCRTCSGFGKTP